jgi:hypothetical protein
MDTIKFEYIRVKWPGGDSKGAKILINGKDYKIVVEKKHKIEYVYQDADWLYKQLSNPKEASDDYPGDVAIFTCTCGVDGCGGFYCKVSEDDNEVTWSGFHATSNYEIYKSIQPLRFDKSAYMAALEHLKSFVSIQEEQE